MTEVHTCPSENIRWPHARHDATDLAVVSRTAFDNKLWDSIMTLAQFSAAVPVPSVVGAYRAKAGATLDRIYGRNIVRLRLSLICVIDQAIGESS